MSVLLPESEPALAPVRSWLVDDARREADRLVGEARRAAADQLDRARQEAAQAVARAGAEGEEQAAEAAERAMARARRQARGVVLAAQEQVRSQLRDAVRDAVSTLRREPTYPAVLTALATTAREVLGPQALVHEAPDGGVLAEAGSRRVDLSLGALAERALDDLEAEVARLWST